MLLPTIHIPTGGPQSFALAAEGKTAVRILQLFADLLELPPASPEEADSRVLTLRSPELLSGESIPADRFRTSGICHPSTGGRRILQLDDPRLCTRHSYRILYMRLLLTTGWLYAILDDASNQSVLLHGSLTEKDDSSVLLFGSSGIGKSTTMRRWQQAGGKCFADDLLLLSARDGKFFCRPLPTWSACIADKEMRRKYPVRHETELKGLLWLTRSGDGEKENIATPSGAHWRGQLLAALTLHLYDPMRILSPAEKRRTGEHNLQMAVRLESAFSQKTLRAALDGDLNQTLAPLFSGAPTT